MAILENIRDRFRNRRRNEEEQEGPDLDMLARGRTAEESDAYQLGQKMAADSMMTAAGVQPYRSGISTQGGSRMNSQRLNKATETLIKYQSGKASVDNRVIAAQQWWKLKNWEQIRANRGTKGTTAQPSNTGWLWNCIVGKHADAIDSFPEPIILPRAADDKEEAQRLSSILPVVLEMNDFEQTYNDCSWQKMQEGTGVYGVFWNSSKQNGLGDIDIKKVSILNLFWEPGINDIQDSRNVFYVSFEDKEDMEARYPELKGKLRNNKLTAKMYKTDDQVNTQDKIPVIDWYYKVYQDGRTVLHYCKYVGETVIYCSEEDTTAPEGKEPPAVEGYYSDGLYPFVMDPLYPVEGSPAGYGMIDIARDVQSDIDTLNQALVMNAVVRATPRYFMRQDCGVNEEDFVDLSKAIVKTKGAVNQDVLRAIEAANMGTEARNMLQQKIDEIKFVTGNTDVNNGGVPTGVTAASAIAALKEDSGRSSKDSTKAAYRSYRKIIVMVIERIRQFYDIPRMFRIVGPRSQEKFETYSNANLQVQQIASMDPNAEPDLRMPVFDVEVRAQRETAYTKLSNNEMALQFYDKGLLNPQMADQALMVLDVMDFRGKDELQKKIREQGTMQDVLLKIAQMGMALAVKYEPAAAEEIAQAINGMAEQTGAAPAQAGGSTKGIAGQTAPSDVTEEANSTKENPFVRNARMRAQESSRPS